VNNSDRRFCGVPLNGCSGCRRDFASLRAFDAHRVGDHQLDCPPHENGRRCLDVEELPEWLQDSHDRWTTRTLKARADRISQYHLGAALKPSDATEAA
jgi:hypothetical protein